MNENNGSKKESFLKWLPGITMGTLITIIALNFEGTTLFNIDLHFDKQKETQSTSEQIITEYTSESQTNEYENRQENSLQQPIEIKITKSEDVYNPEKLKEKGSYVQTISLNNQEEKNGEKEVVSDDMRKNDMSDDYTETSEPINDDYQDEINQAEDRNCIVNVDSPGQLILVSNGEVTRNGNVNVSYEDEIMMEHNQEEQGIISCNLFDIVNTENSLSEQQVKCLNVVPGTYVFNFMDCDFKDIDIFFTNIDEIMVDNTEDEITDETYDETFDNSIEEIEDETIIPSEEVTKISMDQKGDVYRRKFSPQYDFVPTITFYSENGIDGTLKILDQSENVLQIIELSENENNIQETDWSFIFEAEKNYYIEISSSQNEDLSEYIYYFEIIDADMCDKDEEV